MLTNLLCSSSSHDMKAVNKTFDEEIKVTDNNDFIQFSMRSGSLLIYRTIADYENNRLAVVGTQWKENYFDQYFDNFTRQHSDWKVCRKVSNSKIHPEQTVFICSKNAQLSLEMVMSSLHLPTDSQLIWQLSTLNFLNLSSKLTSFLREFFEALHFHSCNVFFSETPGLMYNLNAKQNELLHGVVQLLHPAAFFVISLTHYSNLHKLLSGRTF